MKKIAFLLTPLVTVLVCLLPAAPAQAAGAPRTFVSAAGSDSNNCANVATPCRHMAAAFAATAANGEIYVLDPANYGSLTITHGVSIEGHGWASIAPAGSGSSAITINANPGDKINIIGVVLDGAAITNTAGILFNSGGSLIVRDSVIRNFDFGIDFTPNTSASSQLFVSNTLVSDNVDSGILITPNGSGATSGAFSHVEIEHNGGNGLFILTGTQTINMTFSDGVVSNNATNGIRVESDGGTPVNMMVRNSTIANNLIGLETAGTTATASIRATRSAITGNGTAWSSDFGGQVTSYADNNIEDNGSANTVPQQIGYK